MELMMTVLPTTDEAKLLAGVPPEQREDLRYAERHLWQLARVPRLPQRLRLCFFARRAADLEADIHERLAQLSRAAHQACSSPLLRQLLTACLSMGVYMNHGYLAAEHAGRYSLPVGGFKLQSLLTMPDFKAAKQVGGGINLVYAILIHIARIIADESSIEDEPEEGEAPPNPGTSKIKALREKGLHKSKMPNSLKALREWHAALRQEISGIPEAPQDSLQGCEDDIAELEGETSFVRVEVQKNLQHYDEESADALQRLNEDADTCVARLRGELEKTQGICEEFCVYFGEVPASRKAGAISDAVQVLLMAITETVWGVLGRVIEDFCVDQPRAVLRKLPRPRQLEFDLGGGGGA